MSWRLPPVPDSGHGPAPGVAIRGVIDRDYRCDKEPESLAAGTCFVFEGMKRSRSFAIRPCSRLGQTRCPLISRNNRDRDYRNRFMGKKKAATDRQWTSYLQPSAARLGPSLSGSIMKNLADESAWRAALADAARQEVKKLEASCDPVMLVEFFDEEVKACNIHLQNVTLRAFELCQGRNCAPYS